jgi:hypothetical protein
MAIALSLRHLWTIYSGPPVSTTPTDLADRAGGFLQRRAHRQHEQKATDVGEKGPTG